MEELMDEIIRFQEECDWKRFHALENLAKSISIEASDLLEHFHWRNEYDFWVIDTASELKNLIFDKNKGNNKSILLARLCWNWISDAKDDTDVHDIVIDDLSMSWNLGNSKTWTMMRIP